MNKLIVGSCKCIIMFVSYNKATELVMNKMCKSVFFKSHNS